MCSVSGATYAFVEYEDKKDAHEAIKATNGYNYNGFELRVKRARTGGGARRGDYEDNVEHDGEVKQAERIEVERIEAERIEVKRIEVERVEAERVEVERIEVERVEAERVEVERIEVERV
eukprot:Lankesteria_metandrocarpae@DN4696_c0_g1_i5.p2